MCTQDFVRADTSGGTGVNQIETIDQQSETARRKEPKKTTEKKYRDVKIESRQSGKRRTGSLDFWSRIFFFLPRKWSTKRKKKHFLSSLPTRIVVIETAIDVLKKNTFEKGL